MVRGCQQPVSPEEHKFTEWQESARKDVERSFGVLQGKWKALATPIHMMDLGWIAELVSCCIVLHNMGVSDRVMGDCNKRYVPHSVDEEDDDEVLLQQQEEEEKSVKVLQVLNVDGGVVDQAQNNIVDRSIALVNRNINVTAVNGLGAFNTGLAQTVPLEESGWA